MSHAIDRFFVCVLTVDPAKLCETLHLRGQSMIAELLRGVRSLILATLLPFLVAATSLAAAPPDFNRDVRPILAEFCWKCHGQDASSRSASLRLDRRESVIVSGESGAVAVQPGHPESSEVIRRIMSLDESQKMPPVSSGKELSNLQKQILNEWILSGAEFDRHWAFEPPVKPALPPEFAEMNPIDSFVAEELKQNGLSFSEEADRETLIRRVTFDLTGLPPSVDDLARTHESWEQTVDRLLASPHYGERMAVDWLDAARYADTNGYFGDKPRQMWLWRDWVIQAFNRNLPYDQFTIEQLAGDLLPDPTLQQRIATGFNRNHVANNETGIIDEEYRVEYVFDRVDTTMSIWMGLTVGCAQCHDHKFDPISQRDYYQLFAYFNNVPETGLITSDNPPPLITVSTDEQQQKLASMVSARMAAEEQFAALLPTLQSEITSWLSNPAQIAPEPSDRYLVRRIRFEDTADDNCRHIGTPIHRIRGVRGQAIRFDATQHLESIAYDFDINQPWTLGFWVYPDGQMSCLISRIDGDGNRPGLEVLWQKGRLTVNLVEQWGVNFLTQSTRTAVPNSEWHHVAITYDGSGKGDGLRIFVDGTAPETTSSGTQIQNMIQTTAPLRIGRREPGPGNYGLLDEIRIFQRVLEADEIRDWKNSDRILGILEVSESQRSQAETKFLLAEYIRQSATAEIQNAYQLVSATQEAEAAFRNHLPTTLVMDELPTPRNARILIRGRYDQPGDPVQPDTPAVFPRLPEDAPKNRLGLAQWLMSHNNPLTARVAVNRLWKQCFGEGLVRTPGDFGVQGEAPTHPKLLDWLAVTFRESGWDTKRMLKLIVTSRTYCQHSGRRPSNSEPEDPSNRLLARGSSFRMPVEMIRDQALFVSGQLCTTPGGPAVKPWQPDGLWEEVSYNGEESYIADRGDSLWRRSIYTYIKRQSPPPTLLIFDGPTREKCTLQRPQTNTPMQALSLLNDPTFLRAAKTMALQEFRTTVPDENLTKNSPTKNTRPENSRTDEDRIRSLFRGVLSRLPEPAECQILVELLHTQRQRFANDEHSAAALIDSEFTNMSNTDDPSLKDLSTLPDPDLVSVRELAALTIVAHTILNLDEAVTRR
ncbi:MAG: DUF1553 domain-containing protein [Planctomyces sp.]|nr:DUF1553 domain-containing protein [Planctomyces sp.]